MLAQKIGNLLSTFVGNSLPGEKKKKGSEPLEGYRRNAPSLFSKDYGKVPGKG
jgi:hypothetical protein